MIDPTGGIGTAVVVEASTKAIAASAASSLAKGLVTEVSLGAKKTFQAIGDLFINRLADYMTRQFEKHYYLTTLVFQNRKALDDLYIPLTISETHTRLFGDDRIKSKPIQLSKFSDELFLGGAKTLITDSAGMGKSTLLKYQTLQALRLLKAVPIFIELRHLSKNRTIFDLLRDELNPPALQTKIGLKKNISIKC